MQLLSFSLFGQHPIYCGGMIANARLAPDIYPGWRVRVYHGAEVPCKYLATLERHGCELVEMPHVLENGLPRGTKPWPAYGPRREQSFYGRLWRFLAAQEREASHVVFRDADSRLNVRERAAVASWIESGKLAHVMHDHEHHVDKAMLAGMWGVRGGVLPISEWLQGWSFSGEHDDDQQFLAARVWPVIQADVLIHGPKGVPFPPHPPYAGHVGQIIEMSS